MILELIVLLMAIPAGFLVSWFSRDELVKGRKWFRILIIVSAIGIVWFWLIDSRYTSLTFGFIFLLSIVSLMKSHDKKWTRNI